MIYFENASRGEEGLNTHVMSWTMCISLSNFLDRDFFFDFEIPCSTPPSYASRPEFREKYGILLESRRSLVSQLVEIPNRRVFEIDREPPSTNEARGFRKAEFQLIYSHFATTEAMRKRFEGTIVWDSFAVGRIPQTREELAEIDMIEWTHTKLANPAAFYFLGREEKRKLLDSIKIRYLDGVERLAAKIAEDVGPHNAVHLRLGDYFKNYGVDGYAIHAERFRAYVRSTFPDYSMPVLVATDGLHEKEMFAEIFDGYQVIFIDEFVFDHYRRAYGELEFTDYNALSIVNQLLCSTADHFIGTFRSTFTGIIHRLRQERYAKTDFDFFPDERVARQQLNGEGRIAPDRTGFFDWNRFSVFSGDHSSLAWMREWNHELTTIDV
jgi:hypothetical protein